MSNSRKPTWRDIENEQIRVFRMFMEDRDPKHIAALIDLKRMWDDTFGIEPFVPAADTAINNFSLSRKQGAIRRYRGGSRAP